MTTHKLNRLLAIFFIFIGLAGVLPSLYPIAFAIEALFEPFEWLPRLASVGTLIGLGAGYVLLFGYLKYAMGRERSPIRLWTRSTIYNGLLTFVCLFVGLTHGDGMIILTPWPLLLTVLSASAVGRERGLADRFDVTHTMWM